MERRQPKPQKGLKRRSKLKRREKPKLARKEPYGDRIPFTKVKERLKELQKTSNIILKAKTKYPFNFKFELDMTDTREAMKQVHRWFPWTIEKTYMKAETVGQTVELVWRRSRRKF
jgi:hypothetical protein